MGAEVRHFIYLTLLFVAQTVTTNAQPKVEVTAPLNPVETGGVLGVHCQVWNLDSNHEVTIVRTVNGDFERLTLDDGVTHGAEDRVFLAPRQLDDGSMVYFMSIMEVDRYDEGEYSCRIVSKKEESSVSSASVTINIQYFPGDSDPACTPSEPLTVLEGTRMALNCSSEVAYPHVVLSWSRVGTSETFQTNNGIEANRAFSALTLTALRGHNEAVFLCEISSSAFPTKTRSCHVGPLTVIPDKNYKPGMITQIPDGSRNNGLVSVIPGLTVNDNSVNSHVECAELCSTLSASNDAFVWIVATIIGTLLALIFFIMGVFLLIKYCRLPPNPQPRYVAVQQPYHDIYAELDGRRNEGKVYMTLEQAEKPNRLHDRSHDKVNGHYDVMPNLPKL